MSDIIKTAKGQTPYEIGLEFMTALKEMPDGGDDIAVLFDAYVANEKTPTVVDAIQKQISNVAGTGFDATSVDFIKNVRPHISRPLLAYISIHSTGNPAIINTMLGFYAAVFYSRFPKGTRLTLEWVGMETGKGKLFNFRQFFPWALSCKDKDGINIFELVGPNDIYTYKGRVQ